MKAFDAEVFEIVIEEGILGGLEETGEKDDSQTGLSGTMRGVTLYDK